MSTSRLEDWSSMRSSSYWGRRILTTQLPVPYLDQPSNGYPRTVEEGAMLESACLLDANVEVVLCVGYLSYDH